MALEILPSHDRLVLGSLFEGKKGLNTRIE